MRCVDTTTGQERVFPASHEAPVRCIVHCNHPSAPNVVISGTVVHTLLLKMIFSHSFKIISYIVYCHSLPLSSLMSAAAIYVMFAEEFSTVTLVLFKRTFVCLFVKRRSLNLC